MHKICTNFRKYRSFPPTSTGLRIRRLRVRILLGAPRFTAEICGFFNICYRQLVFVFFAFFIKKWVFLGVFYIKSAQNLHSITRCYYLICVFLGKYFLHKTYLSNNAVNAACDSLLTKCAYLVVIDISLCPKTFCTTRKFPVFLNSHVAVVWRNV